LRRCAARVGLGRRGEERTEREVIGAVACGRAGACRVVVAGDADDGAFAQQRAGGRNRAVVLAEVDAGGLHVGCDARVVVHDERHARVAAGVREGHGLRVAQRIVGLFVAVLEQRGERQQRLHAGEQARGVRIVRRDEVKPAEVVTAVHAESGKRQEVPLQVAARRWDNGRPGRARILRFP
jgi:hypothetical protein